MKSGFSTIELLIGMLASAMIMQLIIGSIQINTNLKQKVYNEDIIAALQLYQVFNLAQDVEVLDEEINFMYLNEARTLAFKNNKLLMSPGTIIYYLDVEAVNFIVEDDKIYLMLARNKKLKKLLIGEI